MKHEKIALMIIALFCACTANDKKPEFNGTYVNHASGEYSIGDDTLVIRSLNENSYSITRKTGYQKIREGKVLPKEYRLEELSATYDEKTRKLEDSRHARIFTLQSDNRIIRMGQIEYKKIP